LYLPSDDCRDVPCPLRKISPGSSALSRREREDTTRFQGLVSRHGETQTAELNPAAQAAILFLLVSWWSFLLF